MLLTRRAACAALLLQAYFHPSAAFAAQRPSPDQLLKFIHLQLESAANYKEGDLLTRSVVKKIFVALAKRGFKIEKSEEILKRVLSDDDFLVRQLQDVKGRAFLRKIEKLPGGIDRLDRLCRIPNGEASVRDLIHKVPNGHEWIEAMVTTKRGRILGERLSNSPQISNFNDPTHRIYKPEDLVKAVHPNLKPQQAKK